MAVSQEQFVVDAKGKKTGVILPLKRYQKLMEDLHDLAVVAERRAEAPITFEEMKRRLKKDGVL
jgi:PHD/YefM family antitoxin component YafN of YafNO toxin-antitoxin module